MTNSEGDSGMASLRKGAADRARGAAGVHDELLWDGKRSVPCADRAVTSRRWMKEARELHAHVNVHEVNREVGDEGLHFLDGVKDGVAEATGRLLEGLKGGVDGVGLLEDMGHIFMYKLDLYESDLEVSAPAPAHWERVDPALIYKSARKPSVSSSHTTKSQHGQRENRA
eukprot:CAMPEP_0179992082 /NCGR_PEP_ID=MMETSP0984-20121128/5329_1 /TAXON_ID=483367 /ORGANISM="non described non described, Strain CCMP 2436" /LENGTH=169 /DNA_ID=CAMNT_0021911417 /DNA_START=232 /DNA_END=743 /DNA_ORIENTATION=-